MQSSVGHQSHLKIIYQEEQSMGHLTRKNRLTPGVSATGVLMLVLLMATVGFAAPDDFVPAFPGSDTLVLDPLEIPKYVQPLVIPPVMPKSNGDPKANYNIAVRQFRQQILPGGVWGENYGYPATKVWSYGDAADPYDLNYTAPQPISAGTTFNYPAMTIEAKLNQLTRIRWINELYVPGTKQYLPHLLPVDRTLHWANPELLPCRDTGTPHTDCRPDESNGDLLLDPYQGPVPIVTHVHGAHVNPESDGYPEAWWLPDAVGISDFAKRGSIFDQFDRTNTAPGSAIFGYYNTQRAATLWYHDHTLGMTRLNVYAGPAGFYLLRDAGIASGEPDLVSGTLPGPAPAPGEDPNFIPTDRSKIREIPIAIQGRTFNPDGSLFFPDNRAFFHQLNPEGGTSPTLDIPFYPEEAVNGPSDVAPIWNPEFFGNAVVVNGTTWPVLNVAPAKYRLRLLNGCNARFVILKMVSSATLANYLADFDQDGIITSQAVSDLPFYQIGAEGGLLPGSPDENSAGLLIGPAERADVIVDFSGLNPGDVFYIINEGPDDPYGGGVPTVDFDPANPHTTGQIMKFVVDGSLFGASPTDATASDPASLMFADVAELTPVDNSRQVSLNERESETVFVSDDADGGVDFDPDSDVPFGPTDALVGTVAVDLGTGGYVGVPLHWTDMSGESDIVKIFTRSDGTAVEVPLTETPKINDIEEWEIFNFTGDAHPIHLHLVNFQVVNRETLTPAVPGESEPVFLSGEVRGPETWETGWKDTVIALPGEVTRIRAQFDIAGLYVWHCHIIDHEDNEMMRPFGVVPDLDRNGCVDRTDYTLMLQDLRGAREYDLNGDGTVNIADVRRLVLFFTNPGGASCNDIPD